MVESGKGSNPKRGSLVSRVLAVCCCCCCLAPVVALFLLFLSSWARTSSSAAYVNVAYPSSDSNAELGAYLKLPTGSSDVDDHSLPYVVLIHEWGGINEDMLWKADRLAEAGFVTIVPDLFRGVSSPGDNIAYNIYTVVSTPQERITADMVATVAFVESLPQTDATKMATAGFCFGGNQALLLAAASQNCSLVVTAYGSAVGEFSKDVNGAIWGNIPTVKPFILGIFGEEDTRPTPQEADEFEEALTELGIPHNFTIYAGVGHAFIQPDSILEEDHPLHSQAESAWESILYALKNQMLRPPSEITLADSALRRRKRSLQGDQHLDLVSWLLLHSHTTWKWLCAIKCALWPGHW